jgi:3-hydroxyacyl-[acyl-carrier-protein] dehydratase
MTKINSDMATSRRDILDQLKLLLRQDLKLGPDIAIPDDMPFSGSEADLDSLDILLLLSSIEKQFKIKIPSEAVGKQVFSNLSTLAEYIEEHMPTETGDESLQRLPHRDPFRFLSRITQLKAGESGQGVWSLSGSEPFFAGHFPGNPLVPGVLIAEAMAQLSGLVGPTASNEGKLVHLDVRFDRPVAPPAEIVLTSKHLRTIGILQQFEVSASVGQETVARGMLTLSRPREGGPGGTL